MNTIEDLFKEQIESAIPFTEDMLPTLEELTQSYGDTELAQKKLDDLQAHLGDSQLFYMIQENEKAVSWNLIIFRAWKSEIVNSLQNLEYVRHSTKFPIFVKTVDKEQ